MFGGRGSHGLSARRAQRTKSIGPKGLQLEVRAPRASGLLVYKRWKWWWWWWLSFTHPSERNWSSVEGDHYLGALTKVGASYTFHWPQICLKLTNVHICTKLQKAFVQIANGICPIITWVPGCSDQSGRLVYISLTSYHPYIHLSKLQNVWV